ncbi:MAG: hypothetical protein ACYCO3_07065 [Mycobacteriales bacterium]
MSDAPGPEPPEVSPEDLEREQAARWAQIVAQLSDIDGSAPPTGFRTWSPPEEPEEHYQPPEPPPLPRLSAPTLVAVLACLIGLGLLVLPTALGRAISSGLSAIGVLALVGGASALFYRLRTKRNNSDPDDGAIV